MKRRFLFLFMAIAGALGVTPGHKVAADVQLPWRDGEVRVVSRAPVTVEQSLCTGVNQVIHIKGRDYVNQACVHGVNGETRVAFYVNGQGFRVAAIAFPTDSDFYDIRGLCIGVIRCTYASKTDTLAMPLGAVGIYSSAGYYKHFSNQLERFVDSGTMATYYQFIPHEDPTIIRRGLSVAAVNAFAFSENGRWAIAEFISYGFVRVNMTTGQTRRIMAPGADYGYGFDPWYELAISDTGNEVAAVGRNVGIDIFEVDSQCGDTLTDSSEKYFSREVNPCRGVSIDRFRLFPNFLLASYPRFNTDGTRLGITVVAQGHESERVILSPLSSATASAPQLLALGDSFTSGEGETDDAHYLAGTNSGYHQCHVSDRSYPYLVGIAWESEVKNVACSGAQTNDIIGSGTYMGEGDRTRLLSVSDRHSLEAASLQNFQPGVLRQLDFVTTYMPRIVSISAGGNDAGLMDKLRACLGFDVCEWVKDVSKRRATAVEIKGIYDKLREVISKVREASPESSIVLVGYPRVVNETEKAPCNSMLNALLKPEERRFMDESIKLLNATLNTAAQSEGVMYVDVQDAFVGHRLCDNPADAMNDIRWGADGAPIATLPQLKIIGAESFHPTPLGHSFVAQAILRGLPHIPEQSNCSSCTYPATFPEESPYWKSEGTTADSLAPRQIKSSMVPAHTYKAGDTLSIATGSFVFHQGATVTAELHSQDMQLGVDQADDTGMVSVGLKLPEDIPEGFHTLHLFGLSWSGETIDVYQVIEVRSTANEASLSSSNDTVGQDGLASSVNSGSSAKSRAKVRPLFMPSRTEYGDVLGSSSILLEKPFRDTLSAPVHMKKSVVDGSDIIIIALALSVIGMAVILLFKQRRQGTDKRV